MIRDQVLQAVLSELELRGARVEKSEFYPPGARLYSGRTQPFLDFYLEDEKDYFENDYFALWTSCCPLPECIVKMGHFVVAVIPNQIADSADTSLVFRDMKQIETTPVGISSFVDWLLAYDQQEVIRAGRAQAEQVEHAMQELPEPTAQSDPLTEAQRQQKWNEKFQSRLHHQPTEFLLGMIIRQHILPPNLDEEEVQWVQDELHRRAQENRWMNAEYHWQTGPHPYTREQVIEAGYQFMGVRERQRMAKDISGTDIPDEVLRMSRKS